MSQEDVAALEAAALRAVGAGDFNSARRLLEQAANQVPGDMDMWLKLAAVCRGAGDLAAALSATERGLSMAPRHFNALLFRASLLGRLGSPGAGDAYGVAIAMSPPDDRLLDMPTRKALERARQIHARHVAQRKAKIEQQVAQADIASTPAEQRRLQRFIDDNLRLTRRYRQEPSDFYFPGLPDFEFYERELFPWIGAFEAATADVQAELLGILTEDLTAFAPYVNHPDYAPLDQWVELNRNPDWSACHLLRGGNPVAENAPRCPRTMAAIARLPQPHIPGRGPSAMFSALKPRTRIPPHTGATNARLVVHLPLIVPENCGFRVGNESREWKVGEAWVFDDTLEHEAWNDSDSLRVILIVDVWNPYLSPADREGISVATQAMDALSLAPLDFGL